MTISKKKAKLGEKKDDVEWWDEECRNKRAEVLRQLEKSKRKNSQDEKHKYYKKRRKYRNVMKGKRTKQEKK